MKSKTDEQILLKTKLSEELLGLAYESDDYQLAIDGLLISALNHVPMKVLKEWKQDYLKKKKEDQ